MPMPATRQQAVEHNLECIEIGKDARLQGTDRLDRRRLEFPGPESISRRAFARYLEAMKARSMQGTAGRLEDLFTEHKMYEPAFYSTVVQDWGTNYHHRAGARPQGPLPRRPRPPRAERQHRDDRLPG
jgi:L-rhamnose isomerase/sugar isomerase